MLPQPVVEQLQHLFQGLGAVNLLLCDARQLCTEVRELRIHLRAGNAAGKKGGKEKNKRFKKRSAGSDLNIATLAYLWPHKLAEPVLHLQATHFKTAGSVRNEAPEVCEAGEARKAPRQESKV
jgi:hypothetical protein